MNLATEIPYTPSVEAVCQFLRNIKDEHIILTLDYVDFRYDFIGEDFSLIITVFNKIWRKRKDVIRDQYIDMLFEYDNEMELSICIGNIVFPKIDYPVVALGQCSMKYLLSVDQTAPDTSYFTISTFDQVVKFLCLIYEYNKDLFGGDR